MTIGLVVWLAVTTVAAGAAPVAGTETGDERLAVSNATVESGETESVRIALDEVPDGLAGFEVTLRLATSDVANVTGAQYPDVFEMTTEPRVTQDRQAVTVEAIDLADEIGPGESNVTLAIVSVTGEAGGTTAARVTDAQVDADGGDRIAPTRFPGAVAVEPVGSGQSSDAIGVGSGSDGNDTVESASALGIGTVVLLLTVVALLLVAGFLRRGR